MQEKEYGTANSMKLKCRRFGKVRYMYIDSKEHRADDLFIGSELRVSFEDDLAKPGCDFVVVICTVAASREADFLKCMADLEKVMLLEGHEGYSACCAELMEMLR